MTRPWSGYGNANPFSQWCREHPELDSYQHGLALTDVDWLFQKYKVSVDGLGTREIQMAMLVETKVLNGEPEQSQRETLYYHHQLLSTAGETRWVKRFAKGPIQLWHFGVFVLSMPQFRPDQSDTVRWGVFEKGGQLDWWKMPPEPFLTEILKFERRPDRPREPVSLRRHHKDKQFVVEETSALGFKVDRVIHKRS